MSFTEFTQEATEMSLPLLLLSVNNRKLQIQTEEDSQAKFHLEKESLQQELSELRGRLKKEEIEKNRAFEKHLELSNQNSENFKRLKRDLREKNDELERLFEIRRAIRKNIEDNRGTNLERYYKKTLSSNYKKIGVLQGKINKTLIKIEANKTSKFHYDYTKINILKGKISRVKSALVTIERSIRKSENIIAKVNTEIRILENEIRE